MNESFVLINDVPTHIFTWGPWIEESFSRKEIVLCITGNPGLAGYYTQFLATIYETLGKDIPVWIIGHAGHDEPKNSTRKVPPVKGNEQRFGLDGQIQHKIDFIRQYVPADVKIHLIGHSIGAWMSLELLKVPDISKRIHHCYMLFPTIEHMADTPSGWMYTKLLQPTWPVLYYFALIFSYFPTIAHVLVLHAIFYFWVIPKKFTGLSLKYIRPSILTKIVFLADEEMERVIEPDYLHIEQNKKRLTFYYGASDGWTPIEFCKRLKQNIPDINAEVDVHHYSHAFVLRSSIEMGQLVASWMLKNRVNA